MTDAVVSSPDLGGYPPGSPEWWAYRFVIQQMAQINRYDELERYFLGDHPLPPVEPKYRAALRDFQRMAQTNYVALVANAPIGRMRVKYFSFGPDGEPDVDAKMIWQANDMDLQSKIVHSSSAVFGDSYVLVEDIDVDTGFPTMVRIDPRMAAVEPHPLFPTKSLAGWVMWIDKFAQRLMAVLYVPGKKYTFRGPNQAFLVGKTKKQITESLFMFGAPGSFELLGVEDALDEVPLVRFAWKPDFTSYSFGEFEDVLHIQDRINYMILDRLKIAKDQAYLQRWHKTGKPATKNNPKGDNGPKRSSFEPGPGNLWVTDSPDAEFGQFDTADFKQILEAVRDDIADMSSITQTPAHYLMNRMVNVSGDTLTQSESGFVSKTKLRMEAMGWGWEKVMRLAFKYLGLPKATEVEANVVWADPQVHKDSETSDALNKTVAAGVPIEIAMQHYGPYTADEIAYTKKAVDAQKAQDLEMAKAQIASKPASGAQQNQP